MGCHTWFLKDKELYLKRVEVRNKMELMRECDAEYDVVEYDRLFDEAFNLHLKNKTEYHDLFRTNKLTDDGDYTTDVIYSREECFEWINNRNNKVYFTDVELAVRKLNEFWDEYPNGVIEFG